MRNPPGVRRALLLAVVVGASACSTGSGYTYKLYPGPVLSSQELTTLQLGDGIHWVEIDGMRVARSDFEFITVLPGTHEIRWSSAFGQSNPSGVSKEARIRHDFAAGQHYIIHLRTPERGAPSLWLENVNARQVTRG